MFLSVFYGTLFQWSAFVGFNTKYSQYFVKICSFFNKLSSFASFLCSKYYTPVEIPLAIMCPTTVPFARQAKWVAFTMTCPHARVGRCIEKQLQFSALQLILFLHGHQLENSFHRSILTFSHTFYNYKCSGSVKESSSINLIISRPTIIITVLAFNEKKRSVKHDRRHHHDGPPHELPATQYSRAVLCQLYSGAIRFRHTPANSLAYKSVIRRREKIWKHQNPKSMHINTELETYHFFVLRPFDL